MLDETLGTQGADQDPAVGNADTPQGDPASGAPPLTPQEKYFLEVDERHRYRTPDDAKKAFAESGQRISQLTPWAENAARYGVTDPNSMPKILDDYLSMRDKLAQYERDKQADQSRQQQTQGQAAGQQLDPKDEQNIRYLTDHGFTRKEAIDQMFGEKLSPLEQRINAIESLYQQSQSVQTNATIEAGRSVLTGLMQTEGYPTDNPKFTQLIENQIVAWMEQNSRMDQNGNPLPGTPLHSFYQGGAAMKTVVEQGAQAAFASLNFLRQQQDGTVQRQRSQSAARTSRPLPRQGAPVPQDDGRSATQAARTPGSGGFGKKEMHEKAFAVLQEHIGNGS